MRFEARGWDGGVASSPSSSSLGLLWDWGRAVGKERSDLILTTSAGLRSGKTPSSLSLEPSDDSNATLG